MPDDQPLRLNVLIPRYVSQRWSTKSFISRVNVSNERTELIARSAGTATKISSAPKSIPAASGCNTGSILAASSAFSPGLLWHGKLLVLEPAARGLQKKQTPE